MSDPIEDKAERLREIVRAMGRAIVAYSGGVDSTVLLKFAVECLGNENVIAVTAHSPLFPERERDWARKMAELLNAKQIIVSLSDPDLEDIMRNDRKRCYYCKRKIFEKMLEFGKKYGIDHVLEGTTVDDETDYRSGILAKRELGIKSPLFDAGLRKEEIREISKRLGLPTHSKPSFSCLASRFPYGLRITKQGLEMVEKGETYLIGLGFKDVRVRHYTNLARIEVKEEYLTRFLDPDFRRNLVENLKRLGYVYVTLDLEGLRSGSMNEELGEERNGRIR